MRLLTSTDNQAIGSRKNRGVTWTLINSVPNPWGEVPMTGGGQSVVPLVEAYMARVAEVATKRDCVSRRSHYVPQSYLRAWSRQRNRVRVLDTRNGLDQPRGLRDTCVREDFYRVTDGSPAMMILTPKPCWLLPPTSPAP
jgi:hypothetical protein